MKVFLSWSGDLSQEYAALLHDWLPTVLQTAKPYMSAEVIQTGERWSQNVASELADTNFGIVCLTPYNLGAPWIMFEAGALSKGLEKSRLAPLLFDVEPDALAKSPLEQFQATRFSEEGMLRLLRSMGSVGPEVERIDQDILAKSFKNGWSGLKERASSIAAKYQNNLQWQAPLVNSSRLPGPIQRSIFRNALDVPFYYPHFDYRVGLVLQNGVVEYTMKLDFTMRNVSANQQTVANFYPTTSARDKIVSATLNGAELDLRNPKVVNQEGLTVHHRFQPETEARFSVEISRELAPTNSEIFTAYFYPAENFCFRVTNHSEDLLLAWIEGLHAQSDIAIRNENMLEWQAKEPMLPHQGVRLLWRPK